MSTYIPTKESANACVRLVARLDDPKEFARISGQTHIGAIRVQDLPIRATIRRFTKSVAKPLAKGSIAGDYKWEPSGNRPQNLRLSDDERAKIIEMAGEGSPCIEIAKALDINQETIYTFANRNNIVLGKRRRQPGQTGKVTPEIHGRIYALYQQGCVASQIAWHVGFTRQFVADYCKHRQMVLPKQNYAYRVCQKTGALVHTGTGARLDQTVAA